MYVKNSSWGLTQCLEGICEGEQPTQTDWGEPFGVSDKYASDSTTGQWGQKDGQGGVVRKSPQGPQTGERPDVYGRSGLQLPHLPCGQESLLTGKNVWQIVVKPWDVISP